MGSLLRLDVHEARRGVAVALLERAGVTSFTAARAAARASGSWRPGARGALDHGRPAPASTASPTCRASPSPWPERSSPSTRRRPGRSCCTRRAARRVGAVSARLLTTAPSRSPSPRRSSRRRSRRRAPGRAHAAAVGGGGRRSEAPLSEGASAVPCSRRRAPEPVFWGRPGGQDDPGAHVARASDARRALLRGALRGPRGQGGDEGGPGAAGADGPRDALRGRSTARHAQQDAFLPFVERGT